MYWNNKDIEQDISCSKKIKRRGTNYFDHADLNGNYITSKMKSDGVKYSAWAENIAYISGVTDANALADKFMTNWMNSSGIEKIYFQIHTLVLE